MGLHRAWTTGEAWPVSRLVVTGLSRSAGGLLARIAGDLDLETEPALAEVLESVRRQALASAATEVVIDLRPVAFLDTAGARQLVVAHQRCADDGLVLRVVANQRAVVLLMRMAGIDELLGLRADVDHGHRCDSATVGAELG